MSSMINWKCCYSTRDSCQCFVINSVSLVFKRMRQIGQVGRFWFKMSGLLNPEEYFFIYMEKFQKKWKLKFLDGTDIFVGRPEVIWWFQSVHFLLSKCVAFKNTERRRTTEDSYENHTHAHKSFSFRKLLSLSVFCLFWTQLASKSHI